MASSANGHALASLDAWPRWPGGVLALVGPEGVGKSHMAMCWAQACGAQTVPAEGPVDYAALAGAPVLYEDADRHAAGREEALFHLINMAAQPGGGLLITARTPPSAWPATLADLRSRLNALMVAEVDEPDDTILDSVLRKFFRERNIRPADDVIPYLLRRIERSVPKAREIVIRLDDAADAEGRAISRALARQILETDPPTLNLFD
ncbi:MAG TPA: DnaA/Hda family protein [Caulobacteraceae bacterium]|nr:DnaA/Hda family protein [Caulobacteraceae bacterium]